jgi:hypothetical protein
MGCELTLATFAAARSDTALETSWTSALRAFQNWAAVLTRSSTTIMMWVGARALDTWTLWPA